MHCLHRRLDGEGAAAAEGIGEGFFDILVGVIEGGVNQACRKRLLQRRAVCERAVAALVQPVSRRVEGDGHFVLENGKPDDGARARFRERLSTRAHLVGKTGNDGFFGDAARRFDGGKLTQYTLSVHENFRFYGEIILPRNGVKSLVQFVEGGRREALKHDQHPFAAPQKHVEPRDG